MVNDDDGAPQVLGCTFESNGSLDSRGGGLSSRGDPTLKDCVFSRNRADVGGGIYFGGGAPVLIKCAFVENDAFSGDLMRSGGACWVGAGVTPRFLDRVFRGNAARSFGGAIYHSKTPSATYANCLFTANSAIDGGAVYELLGSVEFINCAIAWNSASLTGGGIFDERGDALTLANCVLRMNKDRTGFTESAQVDSFYYDEPILPVINYTDIQGWTGSWGGVGNLEVDPRFADADGLDDVPGTADNDSRLLPDSPCIDAGDNETVPDEVTMDLEWDPRFVGVPNIPDTGNGFSPIVELGAFEHPGSGPRIVHLDVMPGRCPHRFRPRRGGFRSGWIALVGTDTFDVRMIDGKSVRLGRSDDVGGELRPLGRHYWREWCFRDVATPFDGVPCDCHARRRDGVEDMVLRFRAVRLTAESGLEDVEPGSLIPFTVTGLLRDGSGFIASDCVMIR
jgi:hypothetical protein